MLKNGKNRTKRRVRKKSASRLNLFQFVSHGGAILEPRQPRYFQPVDFREAAFVLEQLTRFADNIPVFLTVAGMLHRTIQIFHEHLDKFCIVLGAKRLSVTLEIKKARPNRKHPAKRRIEFMK